MVRRAYSQRRCACCGQWIGANGVAYVSHMRKHVREGNAEEIRLSKYGGYSYRVINRKQENK